MTHELVKIVPAAANAFKIEIYNYLGNLAYTLKVHSDGERLSMTSVSDEKGFVDLEGYLGYPEMKGYKPIKFSHLQIEGVEKHD